MPKAQQLCLCVWICCYLQESKLLTVKIQTPDYRKQEKKKSLNPGASVLNKGWKRVKKSIHGAGLFCFLKLESERHMRNALPLLTKERCLLCFFSIRCLTVQHCCLQLFQLWWTQGVLDVFKFSVLGNNRGSSTRCRTEMHSDQFVQFQLIFRWVCAMNITLFHYASHCRFPSGWVTCTGHS